MSFNPTYPHNLDFLPPKKGISKADFSDLLLKARSELAELKGYSFSMPNPLLLISPLVLRESVASSNIENINTTLVDVLQNQVFPEQDQKKEDKEVLYYREALMWGFENLKSYGVSSRIITGIQKKLIPDSSGEYRKIQNRIENSLTKEAIYTPPPAPQINSLMGNWESFVNNISDEIDPLIKCAIAHYQFESIHPFIDGNGRTGRIAMVLQLVKEDLLNLPILFISGYINSNRNEYYRLLRDVTANDSWEEFILFMLQGFYLQAKETKETLFKIMSLFNEFKKDLKENHKKIYSADLVETLFSYPIITPVKLGKELDIHYTTASRRLLYLSKVGLLKETKYGKYHLFINEKLMKVMKK